MQVLYVDLILEVHRMRLYQLYSLWALPVSSLLNLLHFGNLYHLENIIWVT